jgi:hypothetical protein
MFHCTFGNHVTRKRVYLVRSHWMCNHCLLEITEYLSPVHKTPHHTPLFPLQLPTPKPNSLFPAPEYLSVPPASQTPNLPTVMLANLFTLLAITGLATATVLPARSDCKTGQYRCDPSNTSVQICGASGWQLQAVCAGPTCAYNAADAVPYCH